MTDFLHLKINRILEVLGSSFGSKISDIEKVLLLDALERRGGVKYQTARDLKVTYRLFNYKYARYGPDAPRKVWKGFHIVERESGVLGPNTENLIPR